MIKYFIFILLIPLCWISCSDDNMPYDIGNDQVDVRTRMAFTDTLTVRSYTVMMDSIATSGVSAPAMVIGRYVDEEIGVVSASSFFRLSLPLRPSSNSDYNMPFDAVFDSIRLCLLYNEYYSGDTTLPFTINVHRLTEKLEPNEDGYFYNNDSISCSTDLFGTKVFRPSPHSKDTIWITVDQDFGNELFAMLMDNDLRVKESNYFFEYFKGLMFRYDESNNAILGFEFPASESGKFVPAMRLYYHYVDENIRYASLDFKAQRSDPDTKDALQFNQFRLRNPKVSFPASQRILLPSSLTNNRTYINAGLGIVTRLEIPYLKNLYFVGSDIRLINAVLELEPVNNTYINTPLPEKVNFQLTDNLNRWGNPYANSNGDVITANLQIDLLYQENTRYSLNVTNFLISKLAEQTDEIPALLLTITGDDLYKTIHRAVLGSQTHSENKVKLKLYYMNIE